MSIITKDEYDKSNRTFIKQFVLGFAIIVIGFIGSLIEIIVLNESFAILSIVGLLVFICGVIIAATAPFNYQCDRCGEYYKGEHTASECLRILKRKLDNIKYS